jgi:hypothetical protein
MIQTKLSNKKNLFPLLYFSVLFFKYKNMKTKNKFFYFLIFDFHFFEKTTTKSVVCILKKIL